MISGEFQLIKKLNRILGRPSRNVLVGIGDDTAVVKVGGEKILLTTDCLVEDVHFRRRTMKPEAIGHKALAVNLSDIAAMGGTPLFALVSLGLTPAMTDGYLERIYRGMRALAKRHRVQIVGGNITRSPKNLFIDVTLVGRAGKRILRRSGARPGNLVAVTGRLGGCAAWVSGRGKPVAATPRVDEGRKLAQSASVTSTIDISDGLSSELTHLSEASGVGFEIESTRIPIHPQADIDLALHGGEDYELLFTFDPKKRPPGKFAVIGEVTRSKRILLDGKELRPRGWRHY